MAQISILRNLNTSYMNSLDSVTASELAEQLKTNSVKTEDLPKGNIITKEIRKMNEIYSEESARGIRWNIVNKWSEKSISAKNMDIGAKYSSEAMLITWTPSGTGNSTVAYFSEAITNANLDRIKLNGILSNAKRKEIAGKDLTACDLYFKRILKLLIEEMIGSDMTKMPKHNGGI